MDKNREPNYQLVVASQKPNIVMCLMKACEEVNKGAVEKHHDSLIQAFRQIDTKKSEYDTWKTAVQSMVISPKKVTEIIDGKPQEIEVKRITKSRNISYLSRTMGRDNMSAILRILIANLNESFNINNGLKLFQIKELSENILDEVGDLLFVDELIYIFKKAKTRTKLYNQLDQSVIFGWIDEYLKNRIERQYSEHLHFKADSYTSTYSDEISKKFNLTPDKELERYRQRDLSSKVGTLNNPKKKKKK